MFPLALAQLARGPLVPQGACSFMEQGHGKGKSLGICQEPVEDYDGGGQVSSAVLFRYTCKTDQSRSDQLRIASPKDNFCSFTNVINAALREYICTA